MLQRRRRRIVSLLVAILTITLITSTVFAQPLQPNMPVPQTDPEVISKFMEGLKTRHPSNA
jgi:hypothetical protein